MILRLYAITFFFNSLLISVLTIPTTAFAHSTPIAVLMINERQQGVYSVAWNFSSASNQEPPTISFPSHCKYAPPKLTCGEKGLTGQLSLAQLGERYSAAVLQLSRLNQATQTYTLTGANPVVNLTIGGVLPIKDIAASYIPLGFEHILLGVDHLLFVLGLMLLVRHRWMLFKTVTAFTVAHSVTLAAATLGWLGVAERPVNAIIALSIVFIAVEVIKFRRGEVNFTVKYPWVVAFGFGLLHGFGFAGALSDIGLPKSNIPAALLFFNVGVEVGQICFVFLVLALIWSHKQLRATLPTWSVTTSIYGMGAIASFWFLTRMSILLQS